MNEMSATPPQPLDALVSALIDVGGSLSQIVEHMTRVSRAPGAAEVTVPDALASVLRGTLEAIEDRHGGATIDVAGRVVADAAKVIAEEIFLVEPRSPRPHRTRARRSRRRR